MYSNYSMGRCLNDNQKLITKNRSSFGNEVTIKFEPGYALEHPSDLKLIESNNNNNNNNNIDNNGNVQNTCCTPCPTNEIECNLLNKDHNNIINPTAMPTTTPTTTTIPIIIDPVDQSTILCYGCNRKILLVDAIQTSWTTANTIVDNTDANHLKKVKFIENKIFRCTFCHVKGSVSIQNKKTYNNHMDSVSGSRIQIKSEDISIGLVKNVIPSSLENVQEQSEHTNGELQSLGTIIKEEVILVEDKEEEEEEEEPVVEEVIDVVTKVKEELLENGIVEFEPRETEVQTNVLNNSLIKCIECDKLFDELSHIFKEHLRPNLNERPYTCDVWFNRTGIFKHMNEHVKNTHPKGCTTNVTNKNCEICTIRFKQMLHLILKHKQHSLIDEHARCFCNNWNKGIHSLINIKKHIDAIHLMIEPCQIYQLRLRLLTHLKCHFNEVHEQGTGMHIINCTECNLIFENLANVIVDGKKSIDSKEYNVIAHLRQHMHEIHNNERVPIKNYENCEICMKRQNHIIHLLRRHAHSTTHSGDNS